MVFLLKDSNDVEKLFSYMEYYRIFTQEHEVDSTPAKHCGIDEVIRILTHLYIHSPSKELKRCITMIYNWNKSGIKPKMN